MKRSFKLLLHHKQLQLFQNGAALAGLRGEVQAPRLLRRTEGSAVLCCGKEQAALFQGRLASAEFAAQLWSIQR